MGSFRSWAYFDDGVTVLRLLAMYGYLDCGVTWTVGSLRSWGYLIKLWTTQTVGFLDCELLRPLDYLSCGVI